MNDTFMNGLYAKLLNKARNKTYDVIISRRADTNFPIKVEVSGGGETVYYYSSIEKLARDWEVPGADY